MGAGNMVYTGLTRFRQKMVPLVEQDAAVLETLRNPQAYSNGFLSRYFDPPLKDSERTLARREGWILGVA